jgi:hypothetical protein
VWGGAGIRVSQYVEELIRETMSFLPGLDDMIRALEEKVYLSKKAEEEEAAGFSGSNQVRARVAHEPCPLKGRRRRYTSGRMLGRTERHGGGRGKHTCR